jgi:hypothetical protein
LFFWSYIAAAADLWSGWQLERGIGVWCSEFLASQNPFRTIWSTTLETRNFPFCHFEGSDIRVLFFLWFQISIRVWFLGIIFVCAQMRSRFFWEVRYLLIQNLMDIANQKKRKAWRVTTFYGFSFEHDTLVKCIQNLIMIIFIHVKWKWEMQEVSRVLYGCNHGEVLKPLPLHNTLSSASVEQNFDVQVSTCRFPWSS